MNLLLQAYLSIKGDSFPLILENRSDIKKPCFWNCISFKKSRARIFIWLFIKKQNTDLHKFACATKYCMWNSLVQLKTMYSGFTFKVIQRTVVNHCLQIRKSDSTRVFLPKQASFFQSVLPKDKGFQADDSVKTKVCFPSVKVGAL